MPLNDCLWLKPVNQAIFKWLEHHFSRILLIHGFCTYFTKSENCQSKGPVMKTTFEQQNFHIAMTTPKTSRLWRHCTDRTSYKQTLAKQGHFCIGQLHIIQNSTNPVNFWFFYSGRSPPFSINWAATSSRSPQTSTGIVNFKCIWILINLIGSIWNRQRMAVIYTHSHCRQPSLRWLSLHTSRWVQQPYTVPNIRKKDQNGSSSAITLAASSGSLQAAAGGARSWLSSRGASSKTETKGQNQSSSCLAFAAAGALSPTWALLCLLPRVSVLTVDRAACRAASAAFRASAAFSALAAALASWNACACALACSIQNCWADIVFDGANASFFGGFNASS